MGPAMSTHPRSRSLGPLIQTRSQGTVRIAPRVVAAVAAATASECYGVVGMAARGLRDGLAELLNREQVARGIDLRGGEAGITLDLYIIVEHGVRISEVAHNLISAVGYAVEHHLGIAVAAVNVNVQGIHRDERPEAQRARGAG